MNYTTYRSINRITPPKNVSCRIIAVQELEAWYYDDGLGDPWWEMGTSKKPYKFLVTLSINRTTHSSHLTRKPFEYNGLDVSRGLWLGGLSTAKSYKITSVESKTETQVICVIEDEDRHNIFSAVSGSGNGAPGSEDALIFELGDDGLPAFDPLPASITATVTTLRSLMVIESRFRKFNQNFRLKFFQLNHGFEESDVLKLNPDTNLFEKATSSDFYIVGTVISAGPGPNYFYLTPNTRFIQDIEPGLPGRAGDFVWIDEVTGQMTNTKGNNQFPAYIQMTNPRICFVTGSIASPTITTTSNVTLNKVAVTFNAGQSLQNMVDAVNIGTPQHGVYALVGSPKLSLTASVNVNIDATNVENYTFKINGVTIVAKKPGMLLASNPTRLGNKDLMKVINERTCDHGVVASIVANRLVLETPDGRAMNFENVIPTTTTGLEKTFLEATGFQANNSSLPANRLMLVRTDGGEITITQLTGSFLADTGVYSVNNGALPVALVVDKSMLANQGYSVPDMTALNELEHVKDGDHAFVQDWNGYAEWGYFIKTEDEWVRISDYDTARSDAYTYSVNVDAQSNSPVIIGRINKGSRIVDVTIVVKTAFDGTEPSITINTSSGDTIVHQDYADITDVGEYKTNPSYTFDGVGEEAIIANFDFGDSTTGSMTILVSYV